MSIGQFSAAETANSPEVAVPAVVQRPLQRLAVVRRLQGISRRTVARRLNIDVEEIKQQERETVDIPLSTLYGWQEALGVPVAELLVEAGDSLTSPVLKRSQLVRLMKTVLAIRQQARHKSIRRMAETMVEQLVEIMPELANISPWNVVGKRRRLSEVGLSAQRRLPDSVFIERSE